MRQFYMRLPGAAVPSTACFRGGLAEGLFPVALSCSTNRLPVALSTAFVDGERAMGARRHRDLPQGPVQAKVPIC